MMAIYFHGGLPLMRNGGWVMDPSCCCEDDDDVDHGEPADDCCDNDTSFTPARYTLTIEGSRQDGACGDNDLDGTFVLEQDTTGTSGSPAGCSWSGQFDVGTCDTEANCTCACSSFQLANDDCESSEDCEITNIEHTWEGSSIGCEEVCQYHAHCFREGEEIVVGQLGECGEDNRCQDPGELLCSPCATGPMVLNAGLSIRNESTGYYADLDIQPLPNGFVEGSLTPGGTLRWSKHLGTEKPDCATLAIAGFKSEENPGGWDPELCGPTDGGMYPFTGDTMFSIAPGP